MLFRSKVIEALVDKSDESSQIAKMIDIMKHMGIQIQSIKMSSQDETTIKVRFFVSLPRGTTSEQVAEKIKQ